MKCKHDMNIMRGIGHIILLYCAVNLVATWIKGKRKRVELEGLRMKLREQWYKKSLESMMVKWDEANDVEQM